LICLWARIDRRSWLRMLLAPIMLVAAIFVAGDGCRHEYDVPKLNRATPAATRAGDVVSSRNRTSTEPRAGPRDSASEATTSIRFHEVECSGGIAFMHVSGNSAEKYYPTANGSGVAMVDFDGDGVLDLYFATTRNFPLDAPTTSQGNRLFRGRGDGTFVDVTDRAGVGFRGFCHGIAVGDVDNNGYPDLYLTNFGPNVLYLNNGDGTFRMARDFGAECPPWSTSAAFLDYDRDGWLDLYVTCYGHWSYDEPHAFCGSEDKSVRIYCPPTMIPPARHFLFHNRGDGTFEDTTQRAGVLRQDGRGMGVVTADVNRDGLIDIYVANDMCPHFLFMNKGDGTFEDITNSSGAALTESGRFQGGMGVDIEDLDDDGFPELFVTNFDGEYNTIHKTTDGKNFDDVSAAAGIVRDSMPDVGWGCALADFDNDGLSDMLTFNGHVDDNLGRLGRAGDYAQPAKIWRNVGRCRFRLLSDAGPFFDRGHACRGAAFGDLDNDGDIDVAINQINDRPVILLNESGRRHWLRLEFVPTKSNRSAIGTAVEVKVGGRVLYRQVKGGGSYASANDLRLTIGVGDAEKVDRVDIRWPGGATSTLSEPELGKSHRVVEPVAASAGTRPTRFVEGQSR
jgi:enediyne biosynthesis protein E4